MGGRLKLTKEDKAWALSVKERDGSKCIVCGSDHYLNSHHLFPRERKDTKYNINNGVTLCVKHHMFCRLNSAHNNPIQFALWLQKYREDIWYWVVNNAKH